MSTAEEFKEAATKITEEQKPRIISLLYSLAGNGCSFASGRLWKDDDCGKDNGRGYDCNSCAAGKLLKELGLTTPQEDERARYEERKQQRLHHEISKKVKRGNRLPKRTAPIR